MPLTPLIVARSQLMTAIELFFADKDPVSVQALAGNARDILEELCRQAGVEPMTELIWRDNPDRTKPDIYALLNLYRNCFKHLARTEDARREDQLTLNQFDDTKNEYLIYVCVEDYVRFRRAMSVPMQIFHDWFCAVHADLLTDQHACRLLDLFPDFHQMTRFEQKLGGAACIARYSEDPTLLAHPDTEPLVVDH